MPPLAAAAAAAAATTPTTAAHTLARRHLDSNGKNILIGFAIVIAMLCPCVLVHARHHFKRGGSVKAYLKTVIKFFFTLLLCICFLPVLIVMIFFGIAQAHKGGAKAPPAAAGAGSTAQPAPLNRPSMPLDPIALAPEEPDLGDPDDPASYLRRPPPAATAAGADTGAGTGTAAVAATTATTSDDSPPSFAEAVLQKPAAVLLRPASSSLPPPPDYEPIDPSRRQGPTP